MIAQEISLYFHIPFCSKKCPYCHFFVLPNDDALKISFLQGLLQEWKLRLPQLRGKKVVSIYFGGGTPTKLKPESYQQLLDAIRSSDCMIDQSCEITLEANPEDISQSLIEEYAALGINRLSLGVQSLIDEELILLGRSHHSSRSISAIHEAFEGGIENISIDLMFELPRQTLKTWDQTLRVLSSLKISHLSLYNLTFEPQTLFYKKRQELLPQVPTDIEGLHMLQNALSHLESLGFRRYEISAFAKPGKESRHNTGYWMGREFLGFGPSAFSYWEGRRFSNRAHLGNYLAQVHKNLFPVDFEEKLEFPYNLQEKLAVGLRMSDGVDSILLAQKYGPFPFPLTQVLENLIKRGWVLRQGDWLKLTEEGKIFYDSVASEIV